MKTKTEKISNIDKNSVVMRNQQKNIPKIASPRNLNLKDHPSLKNQKDINRSSIKNQDTNANTLKSPTSKSNIEIQQSFEKPNSKIEKNTDVKNQIKVIPSQKSTTQLNSKTGQQARFLRSKNNPIQKQDDKPQKILQQKNEKYEQLQKLNQQLQTKVDILNQQKQKIQQILNQYKTQKQGLQKNLQKLKNVAAENKKLLKEKAESYNNSGTEIKNLRAQLDDLKLTRNSSSQCEIGVNTQIQENQKIIQSDISHQQKSDEQNNQIDISHQQKTYQTQSTTELYHLVSGMNVDDHQRLAIIKNLYEKIIAQKDQKIIQRQQIIYQQQCELNEFYEQKQNKITEMRPNIQSDESILLQIKQNLNLRNTISRQIEKYYKLMEQNRNQQRQIQHLKRQGKVKQIYYQNDIYSSSDIFSNKLNNKNQIQKLKKEIQDLKRQQIGRQEQIKSLQEKNGQQQMIIKNLKDKKPKVIVK